MKILKTVKKITLRTKISKYQKTTHELFLTTLFLKPKSIEFYRLVLMLKPEINVPKINVHVNILFYNYVYVQISTPAKSYC